MRHSWSSPRPDPHLLLEPRRRIGANCCGRSSGVAGSSLKQKLPKRGSFDCRSPAIVQEGVCLEHGRSSGSLRRSSEAAATSRHGRHQSSPQEHQEPESRMDRTRWEHRRRTYECVDSSSAGGLRPSQRFEGGGRGACPEGSIQNDQTPQCTRETRSSVFPLVRDTAAPVSLAQFT